VPGATSVDALTRTTDAGGLHDVILRGMGTQVQQAIALHPTAITLWIGNNDVLGAALRRQPREDRVGDQWNVLAHVPEARHRELDDVEAVIEILPELAAVDERRKLLVRRADDAGIDGILLAATALALRRVLPQMRPTRLRTALSAYLALVLPYGLLVAVNDGWNEQIVKRGWTGVGTPKVLTPGLTPSTALLIALAVVLYLTVFRIRPAPVE